MPKFLNNIDLDGNQLQNAIVHVSGSAPTGAQGQIYFDSTTGDKALYYYNGSAWVRVSGQIAAQATDTIASGDFMSFSDESEDAGDEGLNISNKLTVDNFVTTALQHASTGTIAAGDSMLFLDADGSNAAKKESLADIATLLAGTGLTASSSVIGVDASQAITALTGGDLTIYEDANNADVSLKMGTGSAESLTIEVLNGGSNKTAEAVHFSTATASGTANHGKMVFDVDGTDIMEINDSGINVTGTLTCDTSITIDSITITDTEIGYLDGLTLGTAAASKVITTDASNNVASIGTVGCGAITSTGILKVGASAGSGVDAYLYTAGAAAHVGVHWDANLATEGTLKLGVDDHGVDFIAYGETSGQYMHWDMSADELVLAGDTKLSFHDAGGGENIIATSDGHLEINSATTLDITAPTVDLNSSTEFNIDTAAYDLNASGAVTIDSGAASNLTTSSGALTITSAAAATWSTAAGVLTIDGDDGIVLNTGGSGNVLVTESLVVGVDATGEDVRFYSNTADEGLFYDASEDELGLLLTTKLKFHDIGGGEEIYASANGHLEINAGTTLDVTAPTVDLNASTAITMDTPSVVVASATSAKPVVELKNTNDDATGPTLQFTLDTSNSAAANDVAGTISFYGDDAGNNQTEYGRIQGVANAVTAGSESGKMTLGVATTGSGAYADVMTITGGANAAGSTVAIAGDLTVAGTTTTIDSTTVSIADPIFELGASGSDDNLDRGIKMKYNSSGAKLAFMGFDDSTGKFTMIPDATDTSSVFSGTAGTLVMTTFEGAVTGDVTGTTSLVTVTDSDADTAFPLVFHDGSDALLDDTTTFTYNPNSGTLLGTLITAATAFVPDADDGATLGTASLNFSDAFLADGAVLNFGDDQDVTLTHTADTGITLNSTMKLMFNDASQYIQGSSNANLDIAATTDVNIEATTLDVNAALDVSGTSTLLGAVTTGGGILSDTTNTDALGTTGVTWSDLYLGDGAVAAFGEDQDVTLTHVADTGLLLNSTMKIQFNDATQFIQGNSGTELQISATDQINLDSTLIDINGAADISGATTITGALTTGGGVLSDTTNTDALGTSSVTWSDIYLGDGAVINLGEDQDTTLTHVADAGILLNSTRQLQFGDSGTYIHQSADGVLDLVSDNEVEINGTTIDINGAVDISGATTITGVLTTGSTIELGHASATTLTGSSGALTVEGFTVGLCKSFDLIHTGTSAGQVANENAANDEDSAVWTIYHGMGASRLYSVEVILDSGDYDTVYANITRPNDSYVVVTFGDDVVNGTYRALVTKIG